MQWFDCLTCFGFQDPKTYVETILEVHHKYNALVLTAFNNDAGFVAALDKVDCTVKLICQFLFVDSFKYCTCVVLL